MKGVRPLGYAQLSIAGLFGMLENGIPNASATFNIGGVMPDFTYTQDSPPPLPDKTC